MSSFLPTVAALRAAAEPTRLRLLALLARAELTVGELCEIVGQSQPRVSRHLKLLSDAGLSNRFREQHWVYYRAPSSGPTRAIVQQLLALVDENDDVLRRDRKRLQAVIAERARRAADELPEIKASGSESIDAILVRELESEPIGALLDVGTGAGHLLGLLGGQATRAVGVDISSDALRLARTNVHGAGLSHCELRRGDMYDLPFPTPTFDTATADRILASADRPIAALVEIARALRTGGRLIIIEEFDALGANPITTLRTWLKRAGFETSRIHPVDTESTHLLVAVARRVAHTTAVA
jgi:DNA-binding transcriptional ArsR family regulator